MCEGKKKNCAKNGKKSGTGNDLMEECKKYDRGKMSNQTAGWKRVM